MCGKISGDVWGNAGRDVRGDARGDMGAGITGNMRIPGEMGGRCEGDVKRRYATDR